jgi:signal peptidase I
MGNETGRFVTNLPPDHGPRRTSALSPTDPQASEGTRSDETHPVRQHRKDPPQEESPWAFWRSVILTLAIAVGIRQFLLEARFIPSGSMLPGLQIQDRLLVEKLSYRSRQPRRGEIVVFHAPHHFDPTLVAQHRVGPLQCLLVNLPLIGSLPGVQEPACDAYIKRVIGVPGDRVVVDPRGRVAVDGRPLVEPYVTNLCPVDSRGMGPCRTLDVVVPPGHVLVLGDNRSNSWDGRFWPGGPFLPQTEIIGRAFWRFFPFQTMGPLGAATSTDR